MNTDVYTRLMADLAQRLEIAEKNIAEYRSKEMENSITDTFESFAESYFKSAYEAEELRIQIKRFERYRSDRRMFEYFIENVFMLTIMNKTFPEYWDIITDTSPLTNSPLTNLIISWKCEISNIHCSLYWAYVRELKESTQSGPNNP